MKREKLIQAIKDGKCATDEGFKERLLADQLNEDDERFIEQILSMEQFDITDDGTFTVKIDPRPRGIYLQHMGDGGFIFGISYMRWNKTLDLLLWRWKIEIQFVDGEEFAA